MRDKNAFISRSLSLVACHLGGTPLWRNGPAEKPVLCNACGSRYRLGKSLENYTPKNFQVMIRKKKPKAIVSSEDQNIMTSNIACNSCVLEDNASSESSTSHNQASNFPIKQENIDENPVQNWGSLWGIPSRKRSPMVYNNSLTTIQKLRKDLHNILRNEDPLNNNASDQGPEDVLIYDKNINKLQIPSTEIGLGSILLKFHVSCQDQQEIEPCSSNVCGKLSHLNNAQIHTPSL
ncbi:hypothetical protein REPUB_Repub04eG0026500 [Reevesia pubescens]